MLGEAFQRFPAEIETVEVRIWSLQLRDNSDGVRVVVKAAGIGERRAQCIFAGMAERRMAEIVRETERLGEILIEAERPGHSPPDLRDFEAVREPDAIMVAVGSDEHLCLVAETAEGDRMDQPVAVTLENVARAARARIGFRMEPAARCVRSSGEPGRKRHSAASGAIRSVWELVKRKASMPAVFRSSEKICASDDPRNGPTSNRARSSLRET